VEVEHYSIPSATETHTCILNLVVFYDIGKKVDSEKNLVFGDEEALLVGCLARAEGLI